MKEPAVHLIRKLCELGWLYIHIQSCTRTMGGQSNGTTAQPGLVAQALVSAVQSELREYFRYLASLEARVIGTQAKVNETTISSQRTAPMSSITSLRQLSAWLVEPFRRLRALATLVDSVMHTKVCYLFERSSQLMLIFYVFIKERKWFSFVFIRVALCSRFLKRNARAATHVNLILHAHYLFKQLSLSMQRYKSGF